MEDSEYFINSTSALNNTKKDNDSTSFKKTLTNFQ